MPVHFNTDGRITVDTVEEAIRFEQHRGKSPHPKVPRGVPKKRRPRLEGWEGFLAFLVGSENATARKILALVQGSSHGLDSKALAAQIETDVVVITGTITGIRRKAAAASLNPDEILVKDPDGRYRVGRQLAEHGAPTP